MQSLNWLDYFGEHALLVSIGLSVGAFLCTYNAIPKLGDQFIRSNLFGVDMSKRDRPKMYVRVRLYNLLSWYRTYLACLPILGD